MASAYYTVDIRNGRIDIYFSCKPSQEIRTILRENGFRWHRYRRCWYHFNSMEHRNVAMKVGAHHKYSVPLLNWLYSATSVDRIRTEAVSEQEFHKYGLPLQDIQEYQYFVDALNMEDEDEYQNGTDREFIAFCKEKHLIDESFPDTIHEEFRLNCSCLDYEDWCARLERYLTNTNEPVQFFKLRYDVDIKGYDKYWQTDWTACQCELGHRDEVNNAWTPLGLRELQELRFKFRQDAGDEQYRDAFPNIFENDFWEEVISRQINKHTSAVPPAPTPIPFSAGLDNTLYVYRSRIVCHRRQHNIVPATAVLFKLNDAGLPLAEITLNVEHCTECGKFFIHYDRYRQYRNRYGIILGNIKMMADANSAEYQGELAENSPLYLNGYNVSQAQGLSARERQGILEFVIYHGVMTKNEVISYLRWFIRHHENRENMQIALRKWEEDLEFVEQYGMAHQKRYRINNIEQYRPNQFRLR